MNVLIPKPSKCHHLKTHNTQQQWDAIVLFVIEKRLSFKKLVFTIVLNHNTTSLVSVHPSSDVTMLSFQHNVLFNELWKNLLLLRDFLTSGGKLARKLYYCQKFLFITSNLTCVWERHLYFSCHNYSFTFYYIYFIILLILIIFKIYSFIKFIDLFVTFS